MSRHTRRRHLCLAFCLLVSTAGAQQTTPDTAVADNGNESALAALPSRVAERNFGFVIGDLLVQRIALPEGAAQPDISALTEASRISTWLERQGAVFTTSDNGNTELTVRYQIVNSPQSIVHAALPELLLSTGDTESADSLQSGESQWMVQAWPFTLGPLTPNGGPVDDRAEGVSEASASIALRADHRLPPLDTGTPARNTRLALLLLAITLLLWLGWHLWRRHRDTVRLPFARAVHTLGREAGKQSSRDDAHSAWQILHRAFNDSAGQVISKVDLASLYESRPWLQPLDSRIRAFFDASAARHYELPPRDEPFPITELARELANRERSHSR